MSRGEYRRGQWLLLAQADRGPPLGEPPDWLSPSAAQAWRDIVAAAPPVLRQMDGLLLSHAALTLAHWHQGRAEGPNLDHEWRRRLYRTLGEFFVPMAARRRLLYGDAVPPTRSRRT